MKFKKYFFVIPLIVLTGLLASGCKKEEVETPEIQSNNSKQEIGSEITCATSDTLYFPSIGLCLNPNNASDFTKTQDSEYTNSIYLVNNDITIKEISIEELKNLYSFEKGQDGSADTFAFAELKETSINQTKFTVYAHGYYPIESDTPSEFDAEKASITGYSYIYTINEEKLILFHSGMDYDAKVWIEELVVRPIFKG